MNITFDCYIVYLKCSINYPKSVFKDAHEICEWSRRKIINERELKYHSPVLKYSVFPLSEIIGWSTNHSDKNYNSESAETGLPTDGLPCH
jgi:hypothetical protein